MAAFKPVEQRVEELAAQVLEGTGLEVVTVRSRVEAKRRFVTVYLDRPGGAVNLDDCQRVSEELSIVLDAEPNLMRGRYFLEVSSPGVFRLLTRPEHFARFVGQRIKVRLREPFRGLKRLRGTLTSCAENRFLMRVDGLGGEEVELSLERVREARLDPDLFGDKPSHGRHQRKEKVRST